MKPADYPQYEGGCEGEFKHNYCPGGYHPVLLGDVFHNGRYKVLHKLGHGGWSTVWAAKDQQEQRYVALKIMMAEYSETERESANLCSLTMQSDNGEQQFPFPMLYDHFQHTGPNGVHKCLVLELMGTDLNTLNYWECYKLGKAQIRSIAKSTLQGLAFLHGRGYAHGDLHIGNIGLTVPDLHDLNEEQFLQKFGQDEVLGRRAQPRRWPIRRKDGSQLEPNMPAYMVSAQYHPVDLCSTTITTKIRDFGESFTSGSVLEKLGTSFMVRAPELIFNDTLDHRVDLWAMGCMLYELLLNRPLFAWCANDAMMLRDMIDYTSDDLPERWQEKWKTIDAASPPHSTWYSSTLLADIEEIYFHDNESYSDFSREEIRQFSELIGKLLCFEPSKRMSAREILRETWFAEAETEST